ncbi:MAG: beta-propeller domain-containing protein [Candidatus Aenigmatarchaeota archaeon]
MRTEFYVIGAILIVGLVVLAALPKSTPVPTSQTDSLKKFASYDELKSFIQTNSETQSYDGYAMGGAMRETALMTTAAPMADKSSAASANDYSTTNIQVAGVDEADIVKNDGKYIYAVSGNAVIIVDAYPAENAKIISQINLSSVSNIFINGDRLIVFGNEYKDYAYPMAAEKIAATSIAADIMMPRPYYNTQSSFIRIYDVSDRANPVLVRNVTASGSYFDSRMIGDYVYAMTNEYVYNGDVIPLPYVMENGIALREFPDIYYFPIPDSSYNYVNIVAVNVQTDETATKTFMMPSSQITYVSQNNIYLTYQKWSSYADFYDRIIDEVLIPTLPQFKQKIDEIRNYNISAASKFSEIQAPLQNYVAGLTQDQRNILEKSAQEKMTVIQQDIERERQKTYISKIAVSGSQIDYKGQGYVAGNLLNQFSMDEHNGYFRVATTVGEVWNGNSNNNVYVLDSELKQTGKLEDLAPGEKIYSARFMGDRLYLVTFKKVDPLFVIDLSNPIDPKVLGKLKIPGYSDYLHPYDETHIIGIGKEAVEASEEEAGQRNLNFAWYQGIKLSLFDVSDVENPKEISKFNIGDRGTDSEALYEHKAFLFDKNKGIVVIPISLREINKETNPNPGPTTYGDQTFEGAYVLSLDLANGFKLKGRITHLNNTEIAKMGDYWYASGSQIRRSLYIGDTLYTLSNKMIKANSLTDLAEISTVALPFEQYNGPYYAL